MPFRRWVWIVAVILAWSSLATGCDACRGRISVGSLRKLGGEPVRLRSAAFSADGKTLFAWLTRKAEPQKDDKATPERTHHVVRYALGDEEQAGEEILRSELPLLDLAVLGQHAVVRRQDGYQRFVADDKEADTLEALSARLQALKKHRAEVDKQNALYRIGDEGKLERLSPENKRCFGVRSTPGARWLAYAVGEPDGKADEAEVFLRDDDPDSEPIALETHGQPLAVAPDGSQVVLLHKTEGGEAASGGDDGGDAGPSDAGANKAEQAEDEDKDSPYRLSLVVVESKEATELPATIALDDGIEAKAYGFVGLAGEQLLWRVDEGLWLTEADGSGSRALWKADRIVADAGTDAAAADAGSADAAAPSKPRSRVLAAVDAKGTVYLLVPKDDQASLLAFRPAKDEPRERVDLATLEGPFDAYALLEECGVRCFGQESSCIQNCVVQAVPLSADCAGCFGDLVACMAVFCAIPCAFVDEADCTDCRRDACDAAFEGCAGLRVPF